MNEPTVNKMKQMKLYGMHNAFKTAIESGKTDHYTLDQFISMLIDAEWDERHNRRIKRSSITNQVLKASILTGLGTLTVIWYYVWQVVNLLKKMKIF